MKFEMNNKPLVFYVLFLLVIIVLNPLLWSLQFEEDFISLMSGRFSARDNHLLLIGLVLLFLSQFKRIRIHRFLAIPGMILTIPFWVGEIGLLLGNEVIWPNHFYWTMYGNSDWLFRFPQSYLLYLPMSIGVSTLYLGSVFRIKKQIVNGMGQSILGVLLLVFIYYFGYSYYVPVTFISVLILSSIYLLVSVIRYTKEDLQSIKQKNK